MTCFFKINYSNYISIIINGNYYYFIVLIIAFLILSICLLIHIGTTKKTIKLMEARSVAEYLNHIKEIINKTEKLIWYRGQADEFWNLIPSLWREYNSSKERGMTHEFLWQAKTRTQNPPNDKDWPGWLILMQHYGLPTRLLDWSKSPLVALFFAVNDNKYTYPDNSNSVVWLIHPGELNKLAISESYIYSIYTETARKMIEPAFVDPKYCNENNTIVAAAAVENDLRMLIQQGAFTIHSSQTPLEEYKEFQKYLYKITIPDKYIPEIRFELDLLGYKRSLLFPDLDNLSQELKWRYKNYKDK